MEDSLSDITIVVDVSPMTPGKTDICWRIVDNKHRRVYAFGFQPSMSQAFEEAKHRFIELKPIITSPKTSRIWYAEYS